MISIIALLSSVVLVAVQSTKDKAQITKAKSELNEFVKALEIYRTSYGQYPTCVMDTPGCIYTYTRATNTGSGPFFSLISQALINAKVYNGNIESTLQNNSSISYFSIEYMSPNTTRWSNYANSTLITCGSKPITSEYLLVVSAKDNKGLSIPLNSSYLSDFSVLFAPSGYCSTVN